jgi:dienelactone hydrolase
MPTRIGLALRLVILGIAAIATSCTTPPDATLPISAGAKPISVPLSAYGTEMAVSLVLPDGSGPFPLAVINHGSDEQAIRRVSMQPPSFGELSRWFVEHGYAVAMPFRPGHGRSGTPYLEDQGGCADADFGRSGRVTADIILAAVDALSADPRVRAGRTIVVGTSAGGWGATALAARNPSGVAGIVSFAGGRGGRDRGQPGRNCAPDRLVETAGQFGRTARTPALWLYAVNDSYFPPEISNRLAAAYRQAGAPLDFVLLPPVGSEGHGLITAPARYWEAPLSAFLDRL